MMTASLVGLDADAVVALKDACGGFSGCGRRDCRVACAVGLAEAGSVLVVTKESLAEIEHGVRAGRDRRGDGRRGGVALHLADTLAAGDGLVNAEVAAVWWRRGRGALVSCCGGGRVSTGIRGGCGGRGCGAGGRVDEDDGGSAQPAANPSCQWGRDGAEIVASLLRHLRGLKNVELMEWATTVDLIVRADDNGVGRVLGRRCWMRLGD